jgi:hypothetical protein
MSPVISYASESSALKTPKENDLVVFEITALWEIYGPEG